MLKEADARANALSGLPPVASDSLLQLIALAAGDPRPDKIDVGVGVFRDGAGRTPILNCVRKAETLLLQQQASKSYLGGKGDGRFAELLRPFLLGPLAGDDRIAGLQTPGGCGALRLGSELIATANPDARVLIGQPTWPNHPPIVRAVGLQQIDYPFYDRESCSLRFDATMDAIGGARPGDVVLLHGCCHNPTGADLDRDQWIAIADACAAGGLLPFVDIAYQGFGRGLEEDAFGLRTVLDRCEEVVVAQSCDKNFSVYRDRVGSLFIKTGNKGSTTTAMAHVLQRAREMWSMPPDHGAAAVRIVLEDEDLRAEWLQELQAMRERINAVRSRIAEADPRLAYIGAQFGMFSMLPLSRDQVLSLRDRHAIYMADSGRFNVVGLSDAQVDRFLSAVTETLDS
jgi:aspartate/tyrosine/aromatic aminotransferase